MAGEALFVAAAVGSALTYSGMDLTRKLLLDRVRPLPLLCVLSAGALPFFGLWWWSQPGTIGSGYWAPGLASVALNVVSNLCFLEAVRMSPFSVTIPMLSLTPVFSTLLGIPMLGEVPSFQQALGVALVVVGAFSINLTGGDRLSFGSAWRALLRERGSLLMAGVALCWSVALPLDKLAMQHAGPPMHGFALNAGVAGAVLLALGLRGRLRELVLPRKSLLLAFLSVLASAVAIALFLVAIANLWIGMVESMKRAIGSALALALGAAFFSERVGSTQIAAVGAMSVGVALVLL